MRIYLHELSETEKKLHFSQNDVWVKETVTETEEDSSLNKNPNYSIDLSVRKLQDVVLMKGHLHLQMGVLCSRCATPFLIPLDTGFESMFTKEKSLGNPEKGHTSGVAYSEPTGAEPGDLEMEYLEKDFIELSDVLKEQIYLHLPVQPLCKEDCKGICPVCGQDQNSEPCQCHRLQNSALANALKRFRTGLK